MGCVRCSASPEQWRLATQAITASCAVTCAHAWLGYVPQGLTQDVHDVVRQLAQHDLLIGTSKIKKKFMFVHIIGRVSAC